MGDEGVVSAVCRSNNGVYQAASVVVFDGLIDPASLEAAACNEALSLALDIQLRNVMVASDCLEVMTNLEANKLCSYSMILKRNSGEDQVLP